MTKKNKSLDERDILQEKWNLSRSEVDDLERQALNQMLEKAPVKNMDDEEVEDFFEEDKDLLDILRELDDSVEVDE